MSSSIGPTIEVGLRPGSGATTARRSPVELAAALVAGLPLAAVMAGTTFVAVTAFVLAYDGSRGAALDAGISQADWYPFCIEGVIVCSSVATLRLRDRGLPRRQRAYPWLILLLFTAVSVAANVLHAWEQPGWMWWSLAFAAVPPLALPICVHLLLMVGRGQGPKGPAATGDTAGRQTQYEHDGGGIDTSDGHDSLANGNGQSKTERALAHALAFETENGRLPSQAELVKETGVSNGTAGNVLRPLKLKREVNA